MRRGACAFCVACCPSLVEVVCCSEHLQLQLLLRRGLDRLQRSETMQALFMLL